MKSLALKGPERAPLSGKAPSGLVVLLHGLGASGDDLIGLVPYIAEHFPDAQFIAPDAPEPCDMASTGRQWFSLRDWSPESMRAGADVAAPILSSYLDDTLARFGFGDERMALVGFSQGTMMALHTALMRPVPCAGVVGFSGALLNEAHAASRPPVCLIHGSHDPVVPHAALARAVQGLGRLGVGVEDHTRPGLGHSIDPDGIAIAIRFLKHKRL